MECKKMDVVVTLQITLSAYRTSHPDVDAVKKELIEVLNGTDVRIETDDEANGNEIAYIVQSVVEV
jgi:hypothetical protein